MKVRGITISLPVNISGPSKMPYTVATKNSTRVVQETYIKHRNKVKIMCWSRIALTKKQNKDLERIFSVSFRRTVM